MKMFSIRRNWPKLVAAPAEPSPTDCLNGMRVLSMVWIVLGHTMMMPAPINGFDNPEDLVAKFGARSQVWFMTVIGGQIAVDTFFFLGGFLVAYLGVRDLEKRGGKIPYGAMVLHRYLRITPGLRLHDGLLLADRVQDRRWTLLREVSALRLPAVRQRELGDVPRVPPQLCSL
jgi:hypothetical protein